MKLILHLTHVSRRTAFLAILAGCLCGASTAGLVVLINLVLNSATPVNSGYLLAFVGLLIALIGLTIWSQALLVQLAEGSVYELRLHLSRQILATPLRRLEALGAPRLMAVLTGDIADISTGYLNLPTLFIQGTALLIGLVYLGVLSWALLLAGVVFLVVGALGYLALAQRAQRALRSAREKQDSLFDHFRGLTEGTKELKIHRSRREAFLKDLLQGTAQVTREYTVAGMKTYAVARGWGNSLFFVLIGLLLFGLPLVQPISAYALRGAALIVLYMISPLAIILNMLPILGRAAVALRKVEELGLALSSASGEEAETAPLNNTPGWHTLQLKGITHIYSHEQDDSPFTLGPIDLTFHPGELVFLVGGNGSGKTTLAKVLIGLYPPETGAIDLDDQPVTDANREDYRQLFTIVFSDFYLFEHLLGLVSPQLDAQARNYLIQLQLDRKVQVTDGILSTTALSQGQRKRLALLTAYLENRPFYVFDEWAADQDPLFKQLFYTQLLPDLKARGKTVLVITHDDKYFHVADRLIKLDYGQLIGSERQAQVLARATAQAVGAA
ncbi:MAG TPA: cyclic peptide export ABC transporter [Anaerolineae bacterium]|nr:cyclic peptide export ABC transporter [Anaerolineae bacterium]